MTCENPSSLASCSPRTMALKHSSCFSGSNPATNSKKLLSVCLGVLYPLLRFCKCSSHAVSLGENAGLHARSTYLGSASSSVWSSRGTPKNSTGVFCKVNEKEEERSRHKRHRTPSLSDRKAIFHFIGLQTSSIVRSHARAAPKRRLPSGSRAACFARHPKEKAYLQSNNFKIDTRLNILFFYVILWIGNSMTSLPQCNGTVLAMT